MTGTLTPAAVGRIFAVAPHASESQGWFELPASQALGVEMRASSIEAPIRWIEFNAMRDLGVTLADLEAIYGRAYRALPPSKEGTTVVFDTSAAAIATGMYVAAQLWSPQPLPDAVVSQVQLRNPRLQSTELSAQH